MTLILARPTQAGSRAAARKNFITNKYTDITKKGKDTTKITITKGVSSARKDPEDFDDDSPTMIMTRTRMQTRTRMMTRTRARLLKTMRTSLSRFIHRSRMT